MRLSRLFWTPPKAVMSALSKLAARSGISNSPFLEAIRQVQYDVGKGNCIYAHVTLVPHIKTAGEVKTKPTQHSVKELRQIGILARYSSLSLRKELERSVKEKISLFGNVGVDCVFSAVDVPTIYQLPIALHQEGLDDRISEPPQYLVAASFT